VGYIPTTLVPYHDWGPPLAAPSADETAEQHAAQRFGHEAPPPIPFVDRTWLAEPPAVAPAADATAEESVARQYGELPAPGAPGAPSALAEPPWETTPAADETAEQNAAQQFGELPQPGRPGAPDPIAELNWTPYIETPVDTTDQESAARQYANPQFFLRPEPDGTWVTEPIVGWPTADATAEESVARQYGEAPQGGPLEVPRSELAEPAWEPLLEFDATLLPHLAIGAPAHPRPAPDGTWVTEPIVAWPTADATAEQSAAAQFGERPQPGALGGASDVFEPAWFTILPVAAAARGHLAMSDRLAAYVALGDQGVTLVALSDRLAGYAGGEDL
jgi:hypothetical protein